MSKSETEELETDVAELIVGIADDSGASFGWSQVSDAGKQQLRDALNKLIDERIDAALERLGLVGD